MRERFIAWDPRPATLAMVHTAEQIIQEYLDAGYVLTLRQLYYQFVARDLVENTERSYKNLGNIITKARMAGMLSWEAIEDRNREHNDYWTEESDSDLVANLRHYIRFDRWARQGNYVEVWVEKEALGNVIARACDPYLVPHMACKGYLSASEAWRAGVRFRDKLGEGKSCTLLHLGDHDPSGLDMTRDNRERLDLFTELPGEVTVKRLALNMDQVDQYEPPPNPAKLTDTRAGDYIRRWGATSWELDALEPQIIARLIENHILALIDSEQWAVTVREEEHKKQLLDDLSDNWPKVRALLQTGGI